MRVTLRLVTRVLGLAQVGELRALARHRRPRLVPGEAPPAAAVAERLVQMLAAALRELGQRVREQLAAKT